MWFRVFVQILFIGIWSLALAAFFGFLRLADLIEVSLYQYFGSAAVLGWLSGNVYSYRSRRISGRSGRWGIWGYVLAPPGIIYLLHVANRSELQSQAPLAPVYASIVFGVMFLVPATFGRAKPRD